MIIQDLLVLVGGDTEKYKAWLSSYNEHLGGIPSELLLRDEESALRVMEYLGAARLGLDNG